MASVVIIHAADDALPARALGEKLRIAKLTPIIERAPGADRQDAINNASVTIALWSPKSVADPDAADDVQFARAKGKLIHASMQSAQPPEAFHGDQWVDLTGWRGEDDFAAWRELGKLVTERAGIGPLPPPAPRPPSGFFQPGRVNESAPAPRAPAAPSPPRQQAPRSQPAPQAPRAQAAPAPQALRGEDEKKGGVGMILAIAVIGLLVVGGGAFWLLNQSQSGGAAAEWASIDRTDADALRAFIDGEPGDLRDDAQQALATLEARSFEAAMETDSIAALENFLNDFPESDNALAARGRIAELRTQELTAPAPDETAGLVPPTETADPDLLPPGVESEPVPIIPETPQAETPTPTPTPGDEPQSLTPAPTP